MIDVAEPAAIEAHLAQRLRAVEPVLLMAPAPPPEDDPGREAGVLLELLVRDVQSDPAPERLWLLYTAVCGSYPKSEDILAGLRFFQLAPPVEAILWLLDRALVVGGGRVGELLVVTDRVVVDVDHSARHDLHTGIQQVVRRTLPLWARDHPILAVAWTDDRAAWRTLSGPEQHRVLWRSRTPDDHPAPHSPPVLIVPWRTVVVLPETPPQEACGRLAALAQYSGNAVVAIGHDCVPVVSADLVPAYEPQRFSRYLTVLKYARGIAGVSSSATAEFRGFAAALPAQGLPGPTVVECTLPTDLASATTPAQPDRTATSRPPLVLCVGSLEPRKNHLALLYAAERLWRDGLHFELLLIAGSGWGEEVPTQISRLQQAGRPLTIRRSATDTEVHAAYQAARFSILPSLHEGYGLPVAESLACGTPVITTNYGSTAQTAAGRGGLLVDPRDDDALVEAMRSLLSDDHLLQHLRHQIEAHPARTWEHYATDLWAHLVQPALPTSARHSR